MQRNRTVNHGMKSLSNRLPQLWAVVPVEYKQTASLNQFKSSLENWIM